MRVALAALAALALLAGCQGVFGEQLVDREAEPAYPSDLEAASVHFETGLCDGNCPVFSVDLFGNGTVRYVGERDVAVAGCRTYEVPRSNVTAVLNESYRIDFFALNESYSPKADGLPRRQTTVRVGDESHAVTDYGTGWTDAPERLGDFQGTILNRTGVTPLVTGDGARPADGDAKGVCS